MSAKAIIEQLKRLCVLHEHLLTLSEEKTEALKAGKTKELSNILTKEQKYIQAITQTEDDRIKTTSAFLGYSENNTISACIAKTSGSEKEELEQLYESLSQVLGRLKKVNEMTHLCCNADRHSHHCHARSGHKEFALTLTRLPQPRPMAWQNAHGSDPDIGRAVSLFLKRLMRFSDEAAPTSAGRELPDRKAGKPVSPF